MYYFGSIVMVVVDKHIILSLTRPLKRLGYGQNLMGGKLVLLHFDFFSGQFKPLYIKPRLDMPTNTEWQKQINKKKIKTTTTKKV